MLKINIPFAIVFPGQGSQSLGMLADLASNHAVVQETFQEASQVLGYDLWQLCQTGPETQLNQTEYTQPALLAADIAVWRVLEKTFALQPNFMAGHSLGEYSAFVAAGAIAFKDAIALVQLRGQLMQQAAPENMGAMAAIVGLSDEAVTQACTAASTTGAIAAPANFNGTGQIVIAGHKTAVEKALDLAKAEGAKLARLIPVSVPAHSFFMKNIADQFAAALEKITISTSKTPVVQNVNAQVAHDATAIKSLLIEQLYLPVQWTKTLNFLESQQVKLIIEAGPGKVLAGLTKRTLPQTQCISINNNQNLLELQQLFSEA